MANIKSQIKRNRQNDRQRQRNRIYRGEARTAVKNASNAIAGSEPQSKEALLLAISALDKAAEKGVIHKNNAARRKSRLVKHFNAMKPGEVKVEEPKVAAVVEEKPAPSKKKTAAPKKAVAGTTTAKKAPAKKAAEKKPAAKKTAEKKPAAEKKTTTKKKTAPKK